jgi:hypothetical protein
MISWFEWEDDWFNGGGDESTVTPQKSKCKNTAHRVIGENGIDGMVCSRCKDFYPYAEPNQPDGTLICYRCRNNL